MACRRGRQQLLESAALAFAGHGQARHEHHGHGEYDAQQTWHHVIGADPLRVVVAAIAKSA
jgi:hypothetical protein